jgi:CHAT domain-containing protein/Tfp pilus assembly protein PilF
MKVKALFFAGLLAAFPLIAADVVPLRPGVALEVGPREPAPRRYGIQIGAEEYARVTLEKEGGEVDLTVTSPDGKEIRRVQNQGDRYGIEAVSLLGEPPGLYLLGVKPHDTTEAAVGRYRIQLQTIRAARAEDQLRIEAERLDEQADLLPPGERPEKIQAVLAGCQRAIEIWRQLGDAGEEAGTDYRIGMVQFLNNHVELAAAGFNQALAIWRRLGDERQMAKALNQVGRTCALLGDKQCALASFQESISLAEKTGTVDLQAVTLNNLAKLEALLGDLPAAEDAYKRSLEIYQKRGDRSGEALILEGLGHIYDLQGRPVEAMEALERSRSLAASWEIPNLAGNALNSLGGLLLRLGQPRQALEYYLPALDQYKQAENLSGQGVVLLNLGSLLVELGEQAAGEEMLQRSRPLLRDPRDRARIQLLLSGITADRGNLPEAGELAEKALELQQRMENPAGEAEAQRALGLLRLRESRPKEARQSLEQALALSKSSDDLIGQPETLRGLALALSALGEPAAADQAFEQALSLAREMGNTAEEIKILNDVGRSQKAKGDLAGARSRLEKAIGLLESLRAEIAGDELRASHFATQREIYESYVDLLERLDRERAGSGLGSQAFEAAERSRARGMLDFLSQSRVDLHEGDPDLLKEERRLRLEMNAKSALRVERLRKADRPQEVEALDRDLTSLSTQYQIIEARLEASNPRYARLKQPEVRLADIQKTLNTDTVLLEYFLAEPRSYLWLVTPDSLSSFELPGRAKVEELARHVHEELGRLASQTGTDERKNLEELSRILLGPVASHLQSKRLAIVPDGALFYVPFAALSVDASDGAGMVPLIVEHEVVQLPSAAVVREIRRSREGRSRPTAALAVLADPVFEKTDPRLQIAAASAPSKADATRGAGAESTPPLTTGDLWSDFLGLPRQGGNGTSFARLAWTRREAEAIAGEGTGRDVLLALDFRANRDLVTEGALDRYQIVHFATHGVLDTQHPALSGLVFSQVNERGKLQDGFLRLHDIYHLHLSADLVVLSGCETALGKTLRGEGIMGLTRGFFHAGASQVLASLWPVRDRATAELMQRFYRGMFRDGLPVSTALRQAQISMWKERQWRDPYFWAGFVLQGDWQAGAPSVPQPSFGGTF